ncbi:MAG: hypothetical protein KDB74_01605 [Flavobacteriales bacterium]|nr:hypothetical protein [Flavobacteriales bacterium]
MKNLLTLSLILFLVGACVEQPTPPLDELNDEQIYIKEAIIDQIELKFGEMSQLGDIPIVFLTLEEIQNLVGHKASGFATNYMIALWYDASFCYTLVHEYMHIVNFYIHGDPDNAHSDKYLFYTYPSEVCKEIK